MKYKVTLIRHYSATSEVYVLASSEDEAESKVLDIAHQLEQSDFHSFTEVEDIPDEVTSVKEVTSEETE